MGDISAEPNVITDPIPFEAFPEHMERNQSRFPLPTIVMSNLPEKGDSVPVMILLSFCVSRWTTFQWDILLGMDADQRLSDTPGVMEDSKRNRMQ